MERRAEEGIGKDVGTRESREEKDGRTRTQSARGWSYDPSGDSTLAVQVPSHLPHHGSTSRGEDSRGVMSPREALEGTPEMVVELAPRKRG